MESKQIVATTSCNRLDSYLSEQLPDYTRSAIKKLIEEDCILLNGKKVKASSSIKIGDQIFISLPELKECSVQPEDIPLNIVYQDQDLAVINKPQGMTVHMGNGNTEGTLVNALLFHLDCLSGINGVIRPGIVHRIDKDTSGLLVVAKNDKSHVCLSEQIANKTCHRTYLALLEGVCKNDSGQITTYIGRSPNDRIKMAVVSPDKGKLAITDYQVVERFDGYTLCRFDLHTGRTHQIRVHAKYMGYPVVGDPVYGIKKQKFHLNGQLLHAWKLQFVHPSTGEQMSFEAPLPDYFEKVLEKVKKL